MSSGIFRRIAQIIRYIGVTSDNTISRETSILATKISCGLGLIGLGTHAAYETFGETDEIIQIASKYKMNSNGFTDFMVIDTQGRHFNVNNSFWYWKWDSIEDWVNVETNTEKKITINYYGYRIPFLGMFPNVVEISSNSALELGEKEKKKLDRTDILKHTHV